MKIRNWFRDPLSYSIFGLLNMILVIWIARTSVFYMCYVPLIIAAKMVTSQSNPEKWNNISPKMMRLLSFVVGMIICELGFSLLLIFQHELSFEFKATQENWNILAIELMFGVAVFMFFSGISMAVSYFFRKTTQH